MLSRRDEYALPHQAGGIAYFGDIASRCRNLKIVEVRAAEDDARTGWSRKQPHQDRGAAMQANA